MKIAVDPNIPFIDAPLRSIPGAVITHDLTPEGVKDADAVITRTRTRCDEALLGGSRVRFVGTATIGTDHIDIPWCESRGIQVANAPGCNAPAVAQWVLEVVKRTGGFEGRTIGVIGAGHVGSIVIRWARGLGMRVLVNDPPLQATDPDLYDYSTLEDIAREADVITVHTPLTKSGPHSTYHLIGEEFVQSLRRRPLVMNAARGPVADTRALLRGLREGLILDVAIDCWEGEPQIDPELLSAARFATPHIAGYSREGKVRATQMVLEALGVSLGLSERLVADAPMPKPVPDTISAGQLTYDIEADTRRFKSSPETFEAQRNHYELRPEP